MSCGLPSVTGSFCDGIFYLAAIPKDGSGNDADLKGTAMSTDSYG
jgi:hypothetical protein